MGKLHRLDGPAYISASGKEEYFIDGENCSKENYAKLVKTYNNKNNKKEDSKMDKPEIKDLFKQSMVEGAKRNGVRTVTKAGLGGIQVALSKAELSGPQNDALMAFMASPMAEILVKALVGFGVPFVPQLADNKMAHLIAGECRNQSAEDGQREILDKVMEHILPAVMGSIAELQNSPQMRVLMEEAEKGSSEAPAPHEHVAIPAAKANVALSSDESNTALVTIQELVGQHIKSDSEV